MSILLGLIFAVIIFVIAVSLILFVIGPVLLLQPQRRTLPYYRGRTSVLHPRDIQVPFEELILRTAEGFGLHCWLISAGIGSRGTIIYLHGVSECKIVGLPLAKRLFERGYNVFLYDSRRHGDSEGTYCTYGFYEKHDVATVMSYLQSRNDLRVGKVGLFGSSMGAAVAVQVAAMDRRVAAVVAESGFATLRTIFDDYQKRMIKLPWHYLRNLVIKRSERMAHFKASTVSPLEAVRQIHVPLFILHGTKDRLIKCSYSEQLYEAANEPKQLWLVQGAEHSDMAEVGGEEYYRMILGFLEGALGDIASR
jgi:hypothetical protein